MRPYCRALILCTAFVATALLVPKEGWTACPAGQFEWNYWYGGTHHVTCGCTTVNADTDPDTKLPIPWIVDKSINVYISGSGTWTYATTGGVKVPWYYAEDNGYLNGVPNGFTTTAEVKPIGSDTNFYTMLADNQWWTATKTIPTYVTGPKLGTSYKNYPGTVDACNLATAGGVSPPSGPVINNQLVAPKTIAGIDAHNIIANSYYGYSQAPNNGICSLVGGKVQCTNSAFPSLDSALPQSLAIEGVDEVLCAIQTDFSVRCIRPNTKSGDTPKYGTLGMGVPWITYGSVQYTSPEMDVVQLGMGTPTNSSSLVCLLKKDGSVRCGPASYTFDTVPFQGKATKISMSNTGMCALLQSGAVQCTANNAYSTPEAEPIITGQATDIVATGSHHCAIVDSTVKCWKVDYLVENYTGGSTFSPPQIVPTLSGATKLLADHQLVCANVDGKMKCIDPSTGQIIAIPHGIDNGFSEIASTNSTGPQLLKYIDATCVKQGSTIRCWGNDPKVFGTFENMNGIPTCKGTYAACAGTTFGMGLGSLVAVNPNGNDTALTCKVYEDTPEVPAAFINCSGAVPTLQFPTPTCPSSALSKPDCAYGSPRCSDNGMIACGGFDATYSSYGPYCKSGMPTCGQNLGNGMPSCLVTDPYAKAGPGCADLYGNKKPGTYLGCDYSGTVQCSSSGSTNETYTISCPAQATADDKPQCAKVDFGSPTCSGTDAYGNPQPQCSQSVGKLICDGYGNISCGGKTSYSAYNFQATCASASAMPTCVQTPTQPPVEPYTPPSAICGNGKLEPGEQCDDGWNNGGYYSSCTYYCTLKPSDPYGTPPKDPYTPPAPELGACTNNPNTQYGVCCVGLTPTSNTGCKVICNAISKVALCGGTEDPNVLPTCPVPDGPVKCW